MPKSVGHYLACLCVSGLCYACVGTTSTLQTAPTLGKGKVAIGVGASVPVSTRFVSELASAKSRANQLSATVRPPR